MFWSGCLRIILYIFIFLIIVFVVESISYGIGWLFGKIFRIIFDPNNSYRARHSSRKWYLLCDNLISSSMFKLKFSLCSIQFTVDKSIEQEGVSQNLDPSAF
ncbi:unnamed protein product [Acanthoscelides obtectus]|uniref:Uncharacterized protein n=1 Tax=Acanthoscelides obtectus TaxID=200917 RepID=A0A9P0PLZ8_ACAOB|nr:unnamed protein product [Acanthoscelides obtectus]CAK1627725.1 hypothetical protein AOBTE_LOCUS4791 [Acanthoscelides obtectus]